jgi:hypothetical protein
VKGTLQQMQRETVSTSLRTYLHTRTNKYYTTFYYCWALLLGITKGTYYGGNCS